MSVNTVDSLLLGRIDQLQMSAVSQANQVFFIYYCICCALAIGASVLVSQYYGKNDTDSIRTINAYGIKTIFIFGIIYTLLVFLFPDFFMRLYSSDELIVTLGSEYLRKVCLMYPLCGMSVMIFFLCQGVGKVRIVLFTNIISYSVNILLDYLLIYGRLGFPKMGINGIPIGTISARLIELLICLTYFLRSMNISFSITDIKRTDPEIARKIFNNTLPILGHELVWSLGTSSGSAILGQMGKDAVAAYNISSVMYDLFVGIGNGIGGAVSIMIAMLLGKGEIEKAIDSSRKIIRLAFGIGLIVGVITFISKDLFINLYNLNEKTRIYAQQFLTIISFIWPFSYMEIVTMIGILRAGGDGKIGFYTDIIAMWMICIPLASLFAFRLHKEPFIVVATIKFIIVLESFSGALRVLSNKWAKNLTK
ncbi:MAG: MATE family efflux transporter [Erysipelotrichaceae bacterium]|nr:MATE family efflux transporter [Erysipelotrichaceae bacterium]